MSCTTEISTVSIPLGKNYFFFKPYFSTYSQVKVCFLLSQTGGLTEVFQKLVCISAYKLCKLEILILPEFSSIKQHSTNYTQCMIRTLHKHNKKAQYTHSDGQKLSSLTITSLDQILPMLYTNRRGSDSPAGSVWLWLTIKETPIPVPVPGLVIINQVWVFSCQTKSCFCPVCV